jgi:3-deoxy-D-manno-octulosonic-acid transferase
VGGHNPLEPARLGKPSIAGPDAANWAAVTADLRTAGGLAVVESTANLSAIVTALLADPAAARSMGEKARRAAADAGAGIDRLWEMLQPLLPPPDRGTSRR